MIARFSRVLIICYCRYIPGYGLLPVPEPRKSSVTGDSLRKMINILELIRKCSVQFQ